MGDQVEKRIRVEGLKLIVLDGAVNNIENSIGRLQISRVSIDWDTSTRWRTYFFLTNDLNVAINRNPFPFRYFRVFVNLLKSDRLSL